MANPRDILKTKHDEYVLEKLFDEYIVPWYRSKAISAVTYEKARKEIDILNGKKKIKFKSETNKERDDDTNAVSVSPVVEPVIQQVNPKMRIGSASSRAHQQKMQNYKNDREDSQRVLLENCALKKKLGELKDKVCKIRADADIGVKEKEQQIERLKRALDNSKAQVEDLSIRLSKLAGDKLRQGNPDLADLSDANRPTELGKRFSEIYDNEWSDAFENIPIKDEDQKVGILHGIVTTAFEFCEKTFEEQTAQIRAVLLGVTQVASSSVPASSSDKTIRITQVHNCLKDLRKQMAPETANNIANEFLSSRFEQYLSAFQNVSKQIPTTLRTFARKCAELCWLMCVCDPQMALSEDKEGAKFDANVYKPYTKSVRDMKQPVVKLHVWPALHLYTAGALVAKGVAQPGEGKAK